MTLAASREAIGEVTEFLRTRITSHAMINVDVGRPEAAAGDGGPKLNLFLYQVDFDPHLRNFELDEGQVPPLWLVLRYLITAFDSGKESDTSAAHRLLGHGIAALQELNFIRPTAAALASNPEPLKITFESGDVELLSKLMQGSDEKYRLSAAFQVRPVMLVTQSPPSYATPVLSVGPPTAPGAFVMPSLGANVRSVEPARFEAGDDLRVLGDDMTSAIDTVWIDEQAFPVTASLAGEVRTSVPLDTTLAAGSHAVSVSRTLPSGRPLRGAAAVATLAPTLDTATPGALTANGPNLFGDVTLTGRRLGGPDDAIFVAFYADGAVARMVEATGTPAQTSLTASVASADALPPGDYRLILRVNGAQAAAAPEVHWA